MKQESAEKLKQALISTFRKFGDKTAIMVRGTRSYTGDEIVKEIEDETDFGLNLIENIFNLSILLLSRDKIHLEVKNFEKRYDATVDKYLTLNEFIGECYGGLPNEFMLEEQWLQLPLTKPESDENIQKN